MDRRSILKQLAAIPVVGSAGITIGQANVSSSISNSKNIYESLGVETIINCRGTFTILGGSIELPEVLEAMEAASGNFVQYDELAEGIGKRLAEITKCEWGMVSSGCAAGLKHVTAACVTGGNPELLIRIPDLTGFKKTEVIAPRTSRNVYDHAVRNVGITMIDVDTPEEMEHAITDHTAMIYLLLGRHTEKGRPLSLEVVAEIAKPHGIPILADAAAEDLTIPPIHLQRGATVVAYSGGKAIRGPQCAGLLLGDKDILMSAWQASSPHHGPGRDNKVGKEEMLGMLAAVEAWTTRDHEKEWQRWLQWLDLIAAKLQKIDGVTTEVKDPEGLSNHAPTLHVHWPIDKLNLTGYQLAEEVGRNVPRMAIGDRDHESVATVTITPNQMQEGEAEIVANRLYDILKKTRSNAELNLSEPSADISGFWNLKVDFFNSSSQHMFYLDQQENWIEGYHETDFHRMDLIGTIEKNQVKFKSSYHVPGNHLVYYFSGVATDHRMEGSIFLGEYLTANFSATKVERKNLKKEILIPGGPPLAT